ncbi:MAG: hypothetical protein Ct9H300mP21_03120 [Pseudomonadota bacterium]|nr:MAG: hypothetical protein Ct9H300mP21_03120 [Pseudomonadota bacterium]
MVVDVLEVAEVLKWDHFSLLGHSMGAGIASYLAGTIPEKIKYLMLIEGLGSIVQAPEKMPENFGKQLISGYAVQIKNCHFILIWKLL